ncbi:PREDICTED: uncharacterized protein LOC108745686 [Trachymyrmex septentrionalis]|uniref:uncharacterized protein LOC108745686 n=1 Tax=Trachymyrmex septentrionalis TaxID=34720 RepID=UPI00084F0389|nr:PREDICTED: uncharacterized protein LOC108745686 [Trachymyrmex septentrionalis]
MKEPSVDVSGAEVEAEVVGGVFSSPLKRITFSSSSRQACRKLHIVVGVFCIRVFIKGCPTIAPRQQFLLALWKMTTIDSYRSICNRFNIDKATALRAVRRVTRILIIEAPQFISWLSYKEAQIIMRKFEEARGFLNTIGAINGTHIRIEASKENPVIIHKLERISFHPVADGV